MLINVYNEQASDNTNFSTYNINSIQDEKPYSTKNPCPKAQNIQTIPGLKTSIKNYNTQLNGII